MSEVLLFLSHERTVQSVDVRSGDNKCVSGLFLPHYNASETIAVIFENFFGDSEKESGNVTVRFFFVRQ